MAGTSAKNESPGGASVHGAEAAINHARNRVRRALVTKEQSTLPFDRAYVNAQNPNETLLGIHSATLDYYSQVSSYVDDIKERSQMRLQVDDDEYIETNLWIQQIYEASVPESRTIADASADKSPMTEYFQQMEQEHPQLQTGWDVSEVSDMDFEDVSISLESLLPKWQGWTRRYDMKRRLPGAGAQVETRHLRIIIPIKAAWRIYEQLDRCLDTLDLLADIQKLDNRPHHDWGED